MKLIIVLSLALCAWCAPKEENVGDKVAYSLVKYAEFMVIPENQIKLLDDVENEELEKELDVKKNDSDKSDVFSYMVDEMGSAKDIFTGLPYLIESVKECEHYLEEELRKKRDVGDWIEKAIDKIGDAARDVKEFFETDVKEFFETDVKDFVEEDVPSVTNKVSDFFRNDVRKFFEEDVAGFFQGDVKSFFEKDVKDFFSNDVKEFFIDAYEKAMIYFGFKTESGRSTFGERMDDFLSTTRKGLEKGTKFGICVLTKNINNPLLKIITLAFV